ncbi:hypothetical protein [Anaeromyxobacter dehalogenans]|uniref:Uncharacterized protein n=1 Tax=Anaeromyxobacter dehalogenans (strain 2CP-C) TaxID=290397 RepID=Q2IEA6_ANADE|nr:hypothetical protein [Anaeromyxobacter dehalogenans]ABC82911.1 hypothetical protein Adeh_3142 [Anaeromyxobacter dehalogenans 2CP-C]
MANGPGCACPRCGAPRASGPECPRCGVIYAKARARAAPSPAPSGPGTSLPDPGAAGLALGMPARARWSGELDGARRELWIRAVAPPAALLLALALVSSGPGHALLRTFLSMWIHELGHAVTAWLCGHGAFPGPWRTPISSGRLPLVVIAVSGALAALAWRGWRSGRRAILAAGAAGLGVQLVCTLLPATTARALITFGGDAGCMVIGAALVATIWADPEGPLGRGSLRWGFLVIGAAALVDALHGWVRAWRDPGELPLGEIEGVGLSDASTLMQVHRWSASALSGRYVALGLACLAALGATYAVMLARARGAVAAERRAA